MSFNIFDDQLNTRRENDRQMFEGAFADLASILDMGVKSKEVKKRKRPPGAPLKKYWFSLALKFLKCPTASLICRLSSNICCARPG